MYFAASKFLHDFHQTQHIIIIIIIHHSRIQHSIGFLGRKLHNYYCSKESGIVSQDDFRRLIVPQEKVGIR
jgi:hypothetical protein